MRWRAAPAHEWPSIGFAIGLTGGAAVYFASAREPRFIEIAAAITLALAIFLTVRLRAQSRIGTGLSLFLLSFTLGFGAAKFRAEWVRAPIIQEETRPVLVEGWVSAIEQGRSGPRLRLKVHAIAGRPPAQTPRFVRVTHRARLEVSSGRFVRCWSVLRPPPGPSIPSDYDFQRQAYFQQLGAVGYVQGRCRGGALGAPKSLSGRVSVWIAAKRRKLAAHVYHAAGPRAGGFAAAIASGDRSYMDEADQEALRGSGLAHLLAISGLHLGLVGGVIYLVFFRALAAIEPLSLRAPVQKPAAAAAILACAAYLILSGVSISTQRAFIMATVFFGAILVDRAALSLRSISVALTLVVLIHPESVMSPGFQMSFAATGALIAAYDAWREKRRFDTGLFSRARTAFTSIAMTSTIAAGATAPFALYHFDRLAGLGLIANMLAMPVIAFVTAPLAAISLFLAPFGLSDPALRLFGYSLELVLSIAHAFSGVSTSTVQSSVPMPPGALLCLTAGLLGFVLFRGFARWFAVTVAIGAAALVWTSAAYPTAYWAPDGALYISEPGEETRKISLVEGEGLGPLRFSHIENEQDCRTDDCRIPLASGRISIVDGLSACPPPDPRSLILVRKPGAVSCAGVAVWPETPPAAALRIADVPGRGLTASSTECRERPWRPCSALSGFSLRNAE